MNSLRQSIEKSKEQPLWRLLFALSISEIGQVNAGVLAAAFGPSWRPASCPSCGVWAAPPPCRSGDVGSGL